MNRREALKRLVGTTIAVAVALPFVPDIDQYITDDPEELDRRAWWRENFTIQNGERAKDSLGRNMVRLQVSQNGRPDRVMYVSFVLYEETSFEDAIQEIENAVAYYARRKGWVERQNRRHIA